MPELSAVMRGVIRTNIDLVVGGIGQISDGLTVGSTGLTENWLLVGQNSSAENGPYTVTPLGVWARHPEMDLSAEFVYKTKIAVRDGVRYVDSEWQYVGPDAPTLGTTLLDFKLHSLQVPREAGNGLEDNAPFLQLPERSGVAGTWINPILDITDRGVVESVASGAATQTTFIEAMNTVYLSANGIRVEAGAIFVPGIGLLEFEEAVFKLALTLTANTWYYLYAHNTDGLPQIEVSTQRPASPYRGASRMKGGPDNTGPDVSPSTTHRYVPKSALRSGSTANTLRPFEERGGWVYYLDDTAAAPFQVLMDGRASAYASVDCSAVVPPTATRALLQFQAESGNNFELKRSDMAGRLMLAKNAAQNPFVMPFALDANRALQYRFPGGSPVAGNGLHVNVLGYLEER